MHKFKLRTNYRTVLDQKRAVNILCQNIINGVPYQVLLGVTGSGKTFSIANVINKLQMPTLIISHNKTLAAQLYQEFHDFFPENAVSYFVSYYDFYQPEAYIPQTDTYIEKDADINEYIDKLRLATTTNILTRPDTIVVASVSSIYNIGSPKEYGRFVFEFATDVAINRDQVIDRLIDLQYERADYGFHRGTFRVRGDFIEVFPAYRDESILIELGDKKIKNISVTNPLTGEIVEKLKYFILYPSKHFITDPRRNKQIFDQIRSDLEKQVKMFKKQGKILEAHRLKQKVSYDLEMIEEVGYVKGIENYSRYFDGRKPGEAPFSLLDYFKEAYKNRFLVVVDESHITFPQIRGMYSGDLSRKKTLVEYGFRLPAAYDNRPLTFDEFMRRVPRFIATSATPSDWELSISKNFVVEQLVRPTGIPDPAVEIHPTQNQVSHVISEVKKRVKKKQKSLITTLTKRTSEDLAEFMKEKGIKVAYLHSDIDTLERTDILEKLRNGEYDALVGINLLREGLDLPEVSLVAILDADREGFLRSDVSLIQTMGRAARHVEGKVVLYADRVTGSMKKALDEVSRRRKYQIKYNKIHNITPKSIVKPVRERLIDKEEPKTLGYKDFFNTDLDSLTPMDRKKLISNLKSEMKIAANSMDFELAIKIRDKIRELEK